MSVKWDYNKYCMYIYLKGHAHNILTATQCIQCDYQQVAVTSSSGTWVSSGVIPNVRANILLNCKNMKYRKVNKTCFKKEEIT